MTRWLQSVSINCNWSVVRLLWISIHPGRPDLIVVDVPQLLTSDAHRTNGGLYSMDTKAVLIEAAFRMSIVELYREPLRHACRFVRKEAPSMGKESALQAVVTSINDNNVPDRLVPTMLF